MCIPVQKSAGGFVRFARSILHNPIHFRHFKLVCFAVFSCLVTHLVHF